MDRLISMEPSNFVIVRIEPGQKCSGELTLRNVMYTMPVAFRLQPVNKSRYLIKPQSGIISPLATLTVEIIYHLQPVDSINNNNNHISILPDCFPHSNDSFLLQSVVVPGARIKDHASTLDSVPNDWFTNRKKQVFSDSGIKVMFVGSPILVHLVMDGSMDEIREVLERSDPVTKPADSVDLHGETLLHIAIAQSRPDIVQLLLEFHPDIELQSGRSKWSPLEAAAASGDALIVELLLAKNAKTERSESSTHGAIHLAVIGGHTEVLKLLLVKGADVNAGTKDGNTALHLAVEERRKDFARFLLSNGAKPDIRNDSDGSTPLHIAAGVGDERLVKLLIRKGANKYIRNKAGKTPYDVAADYGHIRLFHELKLGDSLCIAARKGDVRTIQKLIHNGAILNGRDQHGWSALHRASFKGKIEAVRFLIDKGIDINGTDDDGYTALHCGVENGQSEVTELLVKRGADVEAKTRKGVTPLEIAESLGYVGISRILVHGGAVRDNGSKNAEKTGRESMESGGMEMMTKMKKKPAERRMTRGSFARTLPQAVL